MKSHTGNDLVVIESEWGGKRHRPTASIRIKNSVCRRRCNNGWMSQLESEAIPVLKPLITDKNKTAINSQSQLIIAKWAVKCAMMFDCLEAPRFFEPVDTSHLLRDETPPMSTFGIWLGRCNFFAAFTDGKTLGGIDKRTGRTRKGHVLTLVFGHLVIQTLSMRWDPAQYLQAIPNGAVDSVPGPWNISEAWPLSLQPIRWPPSGSFSETGIITNFADRFNVSPNHPRA